MTEITASYENTSCAGSIAIGAPVPADGAAIHRLVERCKPLDLNSRYAYLLLCEHFAATCVLARVDRRIAGFVSAYVPPERNDTVFVWQVAVDAPMRGAGIAAAMLHALLARSALRACRHLETTVSPSNTASRRLFHGLARERSAQAHESLLFAESAFGGEEHEREMLIRIGPFPGK
jgi:L-2,4-diaminobutyric acid acetyltransferase